ncbi:hypothetical protein B0H14DRAFT_3469410 [Mycena olivaceomarginata]|nr:hypothetical protein B0H14DRAFT_3469410 [Mycena olivaceomarginata]
MNAERYCWKTRLHLVSLEKHNLNSAVKFLEKLITDNTDASQSESESVFDDENHQVMQEWVAISRRGLWCSCPQHLKAVRQLANTVPLASFGTAANDDESIAEEFLKVCRLLFTTYLDADDNTVYPRLGGHCVDVPARSIDSQIQRQRGVALGSLRRLQAELCLYLGLLRLLEPDSRNMSRFRTIGIECLELPQDGAFKLSSESSELLEKYQASAEVRC